MGVKVVKDCILHHLNDVLRYDWRVGMIKRALSSRNNHDCGHRVVHCYLTSSILSNLQSIFLPFFSTTFEILTNTTVTGGDVSTVLPCLAEAGRHFDDTIC